MYTHAITRKPGENFAQGITTSNLGPPSYELMVKQHAAYVQLLESLGLKVVQLEAIPGYPDAHFVEDTAVITPQIAIITNPGAVSRRGEIETIEPVLAQYRKTTRIQEPGILDGGDVLMVDTHFFIGISERTNREGAAQLGRTLEEYGYSWEEVPIAAGLHLKSSVNHLGKNNLLITKDFARLMMFREYYKILVEEGEAYAANILWINDSLIMPSGCPNTKERLMILGLPIIELDTSEAQKMDGGLTCMSLRF